MRVLYLCHRIPYPPNKGEKIRAFHELKALSAAHEVDLFTLADDAEDMRHQAALAQFCRRVTVTRLIPLLARLRSMRAFGFGQPLTLPYFYSRQLHRKVRQALLSRSYDRIFIYCSSMAQYVERVEGIPILMDLVDVDSDKWLQYAPHKRFPLASLYRREGNRLREVERDVCEKVSCVLVTTEREARLVRELSKAALVQVIPNGVDTDYFTPPLVPPDSTGPTVMFMGDMSYFPNEQAAAFFALQALPLIRQSVPETRFLIVGRNPSRAVQRLAQIDGVQITGLVPDVRDYLAKTHVMVAPFSIAAGIQNKILEAMAYGLPVVGTSRAVQGLVNEVAEVVQKGDSPQELAARVVSLVRDPKLARHIGMEGRKRVSVHYRWDRAMDRLLELVENPARSDSPRDATASPVCLAKSI